MLNYFLGLAQRKLRPLWRLRRSRFYPRIESLIERTIFRPLDGVQFPVAVRLLRDFSWVVSSQNLERDTRKLLLRVLDAHQVSVFWDVGANIGYYSWLVRSLSPKADLLLIEPDSLNAALLRLTIEKNLLEAVEVCQAAACDRSGQRSFVRDSLSGATGRLQEVDTSSDPMTIQGSYGGQNVEIVSVVCVTLDDLLDSGRDPPNLIKIDVEQAELLVLIGASKILRTVRPFLIIEIHTPNVIDCLSAHDYEVLLIDSEAGNYLAIPRELANGRDDLAAGGTKA